MAEPVVLLSAVQATTQLVEQAFRVLARLRKAYERQKNLISMLTRHENELNSIKTIIGIIDDEEDLQIVTVNAELRRMEEVQKKLAKLLERLDPKTKSRANQVARQLVQGSTDEKNLSSVMEELAQVKATLLLRIQVAQVGVIRTMHKEHVANTMVIQRIDRCLRENVQECKGLRIARLLKNRRLSEDGTVLLTPEDMLALSKEEESADSEPETLVDDTGTPSCNFPVKTERIIRQNIAKEQALQFNAAVETDIWKDVSRIVITDNVAEGQALQINYGTTLAVATKWVEKQDQIITTSRRKRHDGVQQTRSR